MTKKAKKKSAEAEATAEVPTVPSLSAEQILDMTAAAQDSERSKEESVVPADTTKPKSSKKKSKKKTGGVITQSPTASSSKQRRGAAAASPGAVSVSSDDLSKDKEEKQKPKKKKKVNSKHQEQAAMMVLAQDEQERGEDETTVADTVGAVSVRTESSRNRKEKKKKKSKSTKKKKPSTESVSDTQTLSTATTSTAAPETNLRRSTRASLDSALGAVPVVGMGNGALEQNQTDEELGHAAPLEATLVTSEDVQRQLQDQLAARGVVEAEVVNKEDNEAPSRRKKWFVIFGLLLVLILAAMIGIIVALVNNNNNEGDSNASSATPTLPPFDMSPSESPPSQSPPDGNRPGPNNPGLPPGSDGNIPESGFVYALSSNVLNFCEHEALAVDCGGHLASIHNLQELSTIEELMEFDTMGSEDFWIGGLQEESTRNDSGSESNPIWLWSDGTEWYDNGGRLWRENQPNNNRDTIGSETFGEHHVSLERKSAEYIDRNGCDEGAASELAGIYLLPFNFRNPSLFPNCNGPQLIAERPVPVSR